MGKCFSRASVLEWFAVVFLKYCAVGRAVVDFGQSVFAGNL